jgi:hypothetical protein
MVDEGSTRGRSETEAWMASQFALPFDGEDTAGVPTELRRCIDCGERADWVLTDRTGTAQGFICVPCHDEHRRRRNRWDRRVRRHLRHAVRRS